MLGINVFDAGPHIERLVIVLELFGGVERLALAERPLAFGAALGETGGRHSAVSFME
jgi:hypothetical protein